MNKLFTTYDVKSEQFGQPFVMTTKAIAIRSFTEACIAPDSEFAKYPEDYYLYCIGEYDSETGTITQKDKPEKIATAQKCILQFEIDTQNRKENTQ